jgi:ribose transport system permease protein
MKSESTIAKMYKSLINKPIVSVLVPFILLLVIGGIVNPTFLGWNNLTSIFRSMAFIAIIAIGMTYAFIAKELDLSVGSVVALAGMICAMLMINGVNMIVAIIVGVIAGTVCGMITGFIIVRFGIPTMIGSLGMMFAYRGIVYVITSGNSLYPLPEGFELLGLGSIFGIPTPFVIFIILAIIFGYILKNTAYGRSIYAIGGNTETAWLSGIKVDLIRMTTYWMTGAMSGVAGVLLASRLRSAQANAGTGWEMYVIASVIVGGTSMFGGVGTVLGTVFGALLVNMINNLLIMMNVNAYWQQVVIGVIIIIAVIFDQYRKKLVARRKLKD